MKKIITAAVALLAMSLAFVSCGFTDGAAEPQYDYKNIDVDLSAYDNTIIGWNPTFTMHGSDFDVLAGAENVKITVTGEMTVGNTYYMVLPQYGNGSVGEWHAYDDKIYDEEGNTISITDYIRSNTTFVLKPGSKQIEELRDCGLVISGANFEITSVTIQYVGDVEYVNTNIADFSNVVGTLVGNGEVILDPDDANISTLKIEADPTTDSKGNLVYTDEYAEYTFTGAADISKATNVTINLRTGYKYVVSGTDVVKEAEYTLGTLTSGPITWNAYCLEADSDRNLINTYNRDLGKLSLKDIKESTDYNAGVWDGEYSSGTGGTVFSVDDGDDKIYPYCSSSEIGDYEQWKGHHLYKDAACTKVIEGVADFRFRIQLISEKGTAVCGFDPAKTTLTGEYADYVLPISKFDATADFDIEAVTGFKILTGRTTEGTFYIDSIIIK